MQRKQGVLNGFIPRLVLVAILATLAGMAFAKDEPKAHPEEGKIVGTGTKAYIGTVPARLFPSYRVETDSKMLELLCDKRKGCGGDKKLEIGDVIHFRIDQYHGTRCAYIAAPEGNNPNREEKLLILSEDLKPDAKDKPAATGAEKN
jgi:hypothetical protein